MAVSKNDITRKLMQISEPPIRLRMQVQRRVPRFWFISLLLIIACPSGSFLVGVQALSASQSRARANIGKRSSSLSHSYVNTQTCPTRLVNGRTPHLFSTAAASSSSTTYESENNNNLLDDDFRIQKRATMELIKSKKLRGAFQNLRDMVAGAEGERTAESQLKASKEVDKVLEAFTNEAFLPPYYGNAARNRVKLGYDALKLQLTSKMSPPYNHIEKRVYLKALRALTGLNEVQQQPAMIGSGFDSNYSSFRILQRLVTGAGIRRKDNKANKYTNANLQEKDFNMVLNSFSNIGRMDMAHKIVALQERTEGAPPLSAVAYSIFLKGYGRLGDLRNVDMIISHAEADGIVPDTVMLNSLLDAYINCNAIDKARQVFCHMIMEEDECDTDKDKFYWTGCGGANRRTYNTMLKGLAQAESFQECVKLSQEMEAKGLWDDVTTNTMVHAAVMKRDFSAAQALLDRYTSPGNRSFGRDSGRSGRHPNVEAYTELLDGYSKSGELEQAVQVMQTMKDRGVEPNVVTFTCMIAALASYKKIEQAKQMIEYMESTAGVKPTAITFNAFISALVSDPVITVEQVDEAVSAFYKMMKSGVRPDDVTISVLILALGRCSPMPRVAEAKALIAKLESNGIVDSAKDEKIGTALIRACGFAGDFDGALAAFKKLRKPDLVAVNTFLDASVRCGSKHVAFAVETFRHYFGSADKPSTSLEPDVISYSILISALLKINGIDASKDAKSLYDEMTQTRGIVPDKAIVDL